ncbi:MAG TPA: MBL fold metallo-hydrolase [Dehalococcoidia bacterium]|nr:MBL fold metallo-hydrolase [Dehalococcoidia bacterium]
MVTTSAKVLSDGIVKIDGGTLFGPVPKVDWETTVVTDRRNRVTLGLNCLLLQVGGKNVLVDTGVGSKDNDKDRETLGLVPSRLLKGLKGVGLSPKDIHVVILTHLHFDHCGGCTRMDRTGDIVTTFPKARYYVQRACWEEACQPSVRYSAHYRPDNFMPIADRGQLELLDGDMEVLPGLNVIVTDGHARGHQMVTFRHGGERIAFLGDLVPTPHHLNPIAFSAYDHSPDHTLAQKHEVLGQALRQGWLLVFSHGHSQRAGYLERRAEMSVLRAVDL